MSKVGRPRKNDQEKAKYNDKITCDVCKGVFSRSARSRHNATKKHQNALGAQKLVVAEVKDAMNKAVEFKDHIHSQYKLPNGETKYMSEREARILDKFSESMGLGKVKKIRSKFDKMSDKEKSAYNKLSLKEKLKHGSSSNNKEKMIKIKKAIKLNFNDEDSED